MNIFMLCASVVGTSPPIKCDSKPMPCSGAPWANRFLAMPCNARDLLFTAFNVVVVDVQLDIRRSLVRDVQLAGQHRL